MPIVFAPPSPAGAYPGLSVEAGKGQALMHDLATLQRAGEAASHAQAQAAASRQHAMVEDARLRQQGQEFLLTQQDRAGYANAQMQQQAEIANAHMQTEAEMQNARLTQQMQMFMLEPTQKDLQRRAQLKGALSDIADAERSGIVLPNQAAEMRAKAMNYLTPLEEQAAKHQMAIQEERHKALVMQNKTGSEIEYLNQQFALGNFDRLPMVTNPATGQPERLLRNHNGEYYNPFAKSGTTQMKLPPGVMTEEKFTQRIEQVQNLVDKFVEKHPEQLNDWQGIYERSLTRMGLPPSGEYGEYFQSRTQKAPQGGQQQQGPPAPQGISNADKPVGGMAPAPTPVGQPFNPADPKVSEKLTPNQRTLVESFDGRAKFLEDPRLTPQEKQAGNVYVGTMRDLVAAYGDVRNFPPNALKQYEEAKRAYALIYNAVKDRPAPPSKVLQSAAQMPTVWP